MLVSLELLKFITVRCLSDPPSPIRPTSIIEGQAQLGQLNARVTWMDPITAMRKRESQFRLGPPLSPSL